jgi:prolyl oligopeptidase
MRVIAWLLIGFAALAGFAEGANVEDPYQWLEEVHGEKPLAWVGQQNQRTLAVLEADPRYRRDFDSILEVLDAGDRIAYGSLDHRHVFNFWQDASHPKGLWRRTGIADYASADPHWETLLDLDKLAADEKENWVWKGADCSPSLQRCLISLSRGGGDAVVVREFDLAAKAFPNDGFTLPEAKSNVAYDDDDTIFFGTDFGPGSLTTSGYPRIVKLWHRGEKISDAKTAMEGKNTDVSVTETTLRDNGKNLAVIVRSPSFFTSEYFVEGAKGWWKLPVPLSAQLQGLHKGQFLFTLRDDWTVSGHKLTKGALISFALADAAPDKVSPISVLYTPGLRSSVNQVVTGRDAVFVSVMDNVIGHILVFSLGDVDQGWVHRTAELPPGGSADIVSTNEFGSEAYFNFQSFLVPPTLYAFDAGRLEPPQPIKSLPARFDASGVVTEQFEATSKDGTKVPYFVVHQKDANGPRPTILYGYGGFEISETPSYSANFGRLWLTRGGTFVLANIRGGGEFGPAWHEAALKTHRQHAFDDFAAVAADIEKRGFTTPAQLGIMGGSNGGLLVSTVMTQHPELLGAVVCQVPLIDMLRYTHIGAGASWIGEYGDPADPRMRAAILEYSPYQNVSAKKNYPPVLFVTATSDDRVTPVHARKMAAKMEAQGHSVLFYENTDGGHAAAADHKQAAEMWALSFVYLARELGLRE